MTQQNQLEIKYDPQVIKLLGNQLYHQFPAVLNELLTNSYDAGAEKVEILLDKEKNEFTISDDGSGMSYDDLQNKYLVIGRNRREEGDNPKRPATGKKRGRKARTFWNCGYNYSNHFHI
ncbi:ATP-binding protein [Lactococcus garvieae]|uniref:ATP-binding protein n=1 Tax=Lactococcus garvieae TaxID=1363 RepID=UPI00254B6EE7|nr:ATP-binding protein [Lactococcus garvieae]